MELIKTNKELEEACKKLNKAKFITIDTEFIREKTYWSQLCLIQVCSGELEFIIDPLEEDIDLKPFIKILNKKSILKVFHSGRQDIEIFFKISGKIPSPIFDTQIAAMVCGFGDSVRYEKLVDKLLKKKIDKSSRFSNWAKRPLTNKQLNYAIGDVTPGQALAHVASAEGILCVEKLAGLHVEPLDYGNIPGCTYASPEIASVGMTEKQAKEKGYEIKVGKFPFSASGKAKAAGTPDGFVKVILLSMV